MTFLPDISGEREVSECSERVRGALQNLPRELCCFTGIQQLQLILLKVALIVAVEFHINVEFVKLLEPPEDQDNEGIVPPARPSPINPRMTPPQGFGKVVGVAGAHLGLEVGRG